MYSVRIIQDEIEQALDLLEPSFPFNFEGNTIAELSDKSASWSYTISIPRTPNNEEVFGFAGSPYVNTNKPYKRYSCNVYANGLNIIKRGVLFLDSVTKTEYKIQIISGVADIFERMKDISFSHWKRYFVTRPITTLPSSEVVDTRAWAWADYKVTQSGNTKTTTKDLDIYRYSVPLLRVAKNTAGILPDILNEVGYSLITDTPASEIDNLWLSMVKLDKGSTSQKEIWRGTTTSIIKATTQNPISFTNGARNSEYILQLHYTIQLQNRSSQGHGSDFTGYNMFITYLSACQRAGRDFQIYYRIGTTGDWSNAEFIVRGDNTINFSIELDPNISQPIQVAVYAPSDVTWRVYNGVIFYDGVGLPPNTTISACLSMVTKMSAKAQAGESFYLTPNCGFSDAAELFKMLCQVFGWFVIADANAKTITAHSWNYITGRKSLAKDWTDKIVSDDQSIKFEFGKYAQENLITLAENSITAEHTAGSFTIPNENLKGSEVALDIKVSSGSGDAVEQFEFKDNKYLWVDTNAPHLVRYDGTEVSHYRMDEILTNHQSLISTLQSVMVVEVYALLTAVDILTFDPFTPIFLRQYGSYFYVNKIADWEDGKVCKLELIKI